MFVKLPANKNVHWSAVLDSDYGFLKKWVSIFANIFSLIYEFNIEYENEFLNLCLKNFVTVRI